MTTLVTGATDLVGSHVTRLLVARGDAVRVLVRERSRLDELDGLDAELVHGDVLDRLFADLARLSGVEPPALKLPLTAVLALARAAEPAPVRPAVSTVEVRGSSLWWAFRSTKAKRALDCRRAHHEDTLQTTIDWYREREPARLKAPGTCQPIALRAAGLGLRTAGGMLRSFAP